VRRVERDDREDAGETGASAEDCFAGFACWPHLCKSQDCISQCKLRKESLEAAPDMSGVLKKFSKQGLPGGVVHDVEIKRLPALPPTPQDCAKFKGMHAATKKLFNSMSILMT